MPIHVTYGYSKDHRLDLKQAVLVLMATYRSSLPIWLAVPDGNQSDVSSFTELIGAYLKQLQEVPEAIFIANAALYSAANLASLTEVAWICRVPVTLAAAQTWVRTAR